MSEPSTAHNICEDPSIRNSQRQSRPLWTRQKHFHPTEFTIKQKRHKSFNGSIFAVYVESRKCRFTFSAATIIMGGSGHPGSIGGHVVIMYFLAQFYPNVQIPDKIYNNYPHKRSLSFIDFRRSQERRNFELTFLNSTLTLNPTKGTVLGGIILNLCPNSPRVSRCTPVNSSI